VFTRPRPALRKHPAGLAFNTMKKRPVGRPRTTGTTPLSTFRLKPDVLADLQELCDHLQTNKTVVVALAIRRMARTELGTLPGRSKAKRKGKG
jgi:FtsZ-interacting cell division protein YlmF